MTKLMYSNDCVRKQFQAFLDGNLSQNDTRELLEVLMDRSQRYEEMVSIRLREGVVVTETGRIKLSVDELRQGWATGIHFPEDDPK